MSGEDLYSGTESMRSGLELDVDKVEAFFRGNLQDFDGNAEITQFKGGQSNPTYKVSSSRWVFGTGTFVFPRAVRTRNSLSTAWAEGKSWPGGLRRMTQDFLSVETL